MGLLKKEGPKRSADKRRVHEGGGNRDLFFREIRGLPNAPGE